MAGSVSVVLVRPLVAAVDRTALPFGSAAGRAQVPASATALAAFWGATDLTPELVGDDDARISPAQFCVAWAEADRG